jgi:fatty acid desaturase
MSVPMSEEEIYKTARKRVEEKKGFLIHIVVYVCVNILLVVIWAVSGDGFPWFIFPLGGWGIGVLFHFLGVFVFSGHTEWERRAVEKEAERLRKNGG